MIAIERAWDWKSGYTASYRYQGDFIDEDAGFPQTVGVTPLGLSEWYGKDIDRITTEDGQSGKYTCMRGSKTGIEIRSGIDRVHAYTYYMQHKMGVRMYRMVKRTGRRAFSFRVRSDHFRLYGCRNSGPYNDFKNGVCEEYQNDTGNFGSNDDILIGQASARYNIKGDFIVVVMLGLSDDQKRVVRKMFDHLLCSAETAVSSNAGLGPILPVGLN